MTSLKAYYSEVKRVVELSDVVLEVLDARDPLGSRCPAVEESVLTSGKRLVLLLNKIGKPLFILYWFSSGYQIKFFSLQIWFQKAMLSSGSSIYAVSFRPSLSKHRLKNNNVALDEQAMPSSVPANVSARISSCVCWAITAETRTSKRRSESALWDFRTLAKAASSTA